MAKHAKDAPTKKAGGRIGTMGERSLHAALKQWYRDPGDCLEVEVDGYHVDIVRGDLLIEIQTRGFASLKRKLADLTQRHRVRLVYPIAVQKWIVKVSADGLRRLDRRKSPRKAGPLQIFAELVSIPEMPAHPNFAIELLLVHEEEVRRKSTKHRNWRRKGWGVFDRRLIEVVQRVKLETPADFARLLPDTLPEEFDTRELAEALGCPRNTAQRMAYCLRKLQMIRTVGKRGNAFVYQRCD